MYNHRMRAICCFVFVNLAAGANTVAAAPPQCTDTTTPSGPDGFYCIDTPPRDSRSFCLRTNGNEPRHVRQLKRYDDLLTESYIKVEKYSSPVYPSPCAINFAGSVKLSENDIVRIAKSRNNDYLMQIWSPDGRTRFQKGPVVLHQGEAGPSNEKFYLTAPANENELGVDYFVMLADDQEGQTATADVERIEKYYQIEIFPQKGIYPACDAERPDVVDGNKHTTNFHLWKTGDTSCNVPQIKNEAGSGAGGSGYP